MAAKKQPTNHDLAKIVSDGFTAVGKRLDKVEDKMQIFNDFMVGEQAVQKAQSSSQTSGMPKEAIDIIKWLVLIIGTLLGVKNIL